VGAGAAPLEHRSDSLSAGFRNLDRDDAGAAIEDVARRFGTSERHVRQRLRLGKLAPELLDAFRAGDIGLDVVTAFTLRKPAELLCGRPYAARAIGGKRALISRT
jgi:hypothetical protein